MIYCLCWEPNLADFGLSRESLASADNKNLTLFVGTPFFMAPELFNEQESFGRYSPAIDVYAYGICLWCMFVGRIPAPKKMSALQFLMQVHKVSGSSVYSLK